VANIVRAVAEPMLASHFGDEIMDELFKRYAEHVGEHLCVEKTKHINIVLTMTKKE
jgi:jasmonate O-methyltransferase